MGVWRIDIYDNELDPQPRARGIIKAKTLEVAIEIENRVMGDSMSATYNLVVTKNELNIPEGYTSI